MTREHDTPEIELLKEVRIFKGLKWFFADLDGTLVNTPSLFASRMREFAHFISKKSRLSPDPKEVKAEMDRVLNTHRSEYKVNPALMSVTAAQILGLFKVPMFDDDTTQAHQKLMKIYNSVAEPFMGSVEAVDVLRQTGFNFAVFTHSEHGWALKKVHEAGFHVDKVIAIPTTEDKDYNQLNLAFQYLETNSDEVSYAGDHWTSDVTTALMAGVSKENIFRIKTSYSDANIGEVPEITQVNSFSEIPQLLVEKWLAKLHSR